jgi:hypothetical protein
MQIHAIQSLRLVRDCMNYSSIKVFFLLMYLLCINTSFPSIVTGTLLKSPQGFIAVEHLAIGNSLVSYSNEKKLTTVTVQYISKTITSTIIEISTSKGIINALPEQLLYDPLLQQWIIAENISPDNHLLDSLGNIYRCNAVKTVSVAPQYAYHVSTTDPHTFFATKQEVLTHNFFPIILIGATWLFGLGSVELVGISLSAIIAGAAISITLAQKNKPQNNITFTPSISGSYGGYSPDPDDDNKNSSDKSVRRYNTVSKSEFFQKVKNDYEYWKDGVYRRKRGSIGIENAEYLEWDHMHNDVEAFSRKKSHMGSIDPTTLKLYRLPTKGRRLPKR